MTRRRLVWIGVVGGLALVTGLVVYLLGYSGDPVGAKASRIRAGMTLAEVEAVFGETADMTSRVDSRPGTERLWLVGKGDEVVVAFDEQDRVQEVFVFRHNLFDRLRAWLGW